MAYQVKTTKPRELRALRRFFTPFPRWVVGAWLVGAVLIAIGTASNSSMDPDSQALAVAGGIALFAIGVLQVAMWSARPSASQVDRWLDQDLAQLKARAIEKCGLVGVELKSPTMVLTGPTFDVSGADLAFKDDRKGEVRFTPVSVTILNFTQHQITGYQCALDRLTGNALAEGTDEFFYTDVVSVTTKTEDFTIDKDRLTRKARKLLGKQIRGGKLQIPETQRFILTTSGTTSIEVIIEATFDKLGRIIMGSGGDVDVDVADNAISSMRQMLREKKVPADE